MRGSRCACVPAKGARGRNAALRLAGVPCAGMGDTKLPELAELERILEAHSASLAVRTLCEVRDGDERHPLLAVSLGSASRDAPAVGFFGGVHGLERVGTQVLLSFLGSLAGRLEWDERIQRLA